MDQKQFDAMLSDGETRLTRLKMLYEQWFLGFERLEPQVLRKEFEDLLAMLRREQISNTALRFRLQQLVQRHTTFSTHWRRVARQIEDGTYQRDVLRARRLRDQVVERDNGGPELELSYDVDLDDDLQAALEEVHRAAEMAAAKSQPSAAAVSAAGPELAAATAAAPASRGQAARPPLGAWGPAQPAASAAQLAAAEGTTPANGAPRPGPARAISPFAMPSAAGAKPPPPAPPSAAVLLGAIGSAHVSPANLNAGPPGAVGQAGRVARSGEAGAPAKPPGAAGAGPVAALKQGTPGAPAGNKPLVAGAAGKPVDTAAKAALAAAVSGGGAKMVGSAPAAANDAAGAKPLGSPLAAANGGAGAKPLGSPLAATNGGAGAKPLGSPLAAANGGAGAKAVGSLSLAAGGGGAGVKPVATANGAASPGTAGANAKSAASPTASARGAASTVSNARPAAAPGTAAARPAAGSPATAAKPAAAGGGTLSTDDVQRIYAQYVTARKQNAERVDNVKLDSIEKTLRGMLPQLEKKHAGKKIDFEVVVKDGKVALKPVAR